MLHQQLWQGHLPDDGSDFQNTAKIADVKFYAHICYI